MCFTIFALSSGVPYIPISSSSSSSLPNLNKVKHAFCPSTYRTCILALSLSIPPLSHTASLSLFPPFLLFYLSLSPSLPPFIFFSLSLSVPSSFSFFLSLSISLLYIQFVYVLLCVHESSIASSPSLDFGDSSSGRRRLLALNVKASLKLVNVLRYQFTVAILCRVSHPFVTQFSCLYVVLTTNHLH